MPFEIDICTDSFDVIDIKILQKYWNSILQLIQGKLPANSEPRQKIVQLYEEIVIKNKDLLDEKPDDEIVRAWWKYCMRKQYEKNNPDWKSKAGDKIRLPNDRIGYWRSGIYP